MQPGDVTTRCVTMDTYLVALCAQYLNRYAKPVECRLLLSLILFAITTITILQTAVFTHGAARYFIDKARTRGKLAALFSTL